MSKHFDYLYSKKGEPLSKEWISSAKSLANRSSIRSILLTLLCCLAALALLVFGEPSLKDSYGTLVGTALILVSNLNHMNTAETIGNPLRAGLRKLSDSGNCDKALALIEKFEVCKEYQTKVLAQGREFIEFDYQLLLAIAPGCAGVVRKVDPAVACKMLHGTA